ncbi:alpha/beta-hydrolase [Anaeromyces robustus]|uniref:Alpha/beta-hydrolase n=1 Tax=Anaeromyces robustus TaxID=1754192 RepID=A0A1Y1WYP3_9FUNG|nr:alpha/beta-hydrolase [Anaeromyces robustus]|eukprot:ORX78623.1 alpha/beta-hydrolase [Anaeromyces robustus]
MNYNIIIKLLFTIIITISFCNANFLTDKIEALGDLKNDYENYIKVTNIERNIQFNPSRTLDVYYNKDEINYELKPVVIHIFGGTWTKGNKFKFTNIGSLLEENDYVAVLPNYGLFPFAVLEDMIYDVYTAIQWTFENIQKYGGDPKRVTLIGHSAGAHLISLTLFKSYNYMENNGKTLSPLPYFEKVVLLAGPYDIDDIEVAKMDYNDDAEDYDNGILENTLKLLFRTNIISPYDIVKSMPDNYVKDSFNVKKFILYYTSNDTKVPESSALKLIDQLKRVCPTIDINYVYKENFGHSDIVNVKICNSNTIELNAVAFTDSDTDLTFKLYIDGFNQYAKDNNIDIYVNLNTLTNVNFTISLTNSNIMIESLLKRKNSKYDIYFYDLSLSKKYCPYLYDLSKELPENHINMFNKNIISYSRCQDKIVGLPITLGYTALYSNKDLLNKYNKEIPKTWDELITTSKEILEKERALNNTELIGYNGFMFDAENGICSIYEFIYSCRESYDSPFPDLNSQTAIEAIKLIKKIKDEISSGSKK